MKFTKKRPRSIHFNSFHDNKSAANHTLLRIYSEQPTIYNIQAAGGEHVSCNNKGRRQETMTINKKCCHKSAAVIENNESLFDQGGDTYNCASNNNNNYSEKYLLPTPLLLGQRQFVTRPLLPEAVNVEILKKLRFYKVKVISIAEEKKNLGNDQYKAQNYQSALKFYSDAISLCPDSATYYGNRAACYMMLSNYTNALNDARTAVRLDPKFEKAYVRIAKCCVAKGDIIGAEQAIKRIEELDAQSNAVNTEKQAVQQLRQLEQTLQTNYEAKEYRNVVFYLDSAIKLAPACYRYRLLKAECLAFLGRCDEAVDLAISVMKLDSTSADAIYVRGLCFYYTDNLEKGIKHFELALQLDPDHKKAKEMRIKSKTLKDMKENGNVLFKSGRYREAQAVYTEALKIDEINKDINSKLLYNRALVHSKINNLREAVADCTRVLEINDKYLKALLLRARCYNDLEKFEECVNDYEAALQIQKTPEIKKLLRDAKFALKKSKRKDYYKILGVSRNAGEDEIKKAYRKKALVHHPDRHANSSPEERKDQELKFKEIGEAYAILSDQRKKMRYDSGQDMEEHEQADFDPNQMFRHFFQFGGGPTGGQSFGFEF